MTDQFLSIDPAVGVTGQPYAFANDNPLNATDPLGLIPTLGHMETDRQVAIVGNEYTVTSLTAQINEIESTAGEKTYQLYEAWRAAEGEMSTSSIKAQRIYESSASQFTAALTPLINKLASSGYDLYNIYSAANNVAGAAAAYSQTAAALDSVIGTGSALEIQLSEDLYQQAVNLGESDAEFLGAVADAAGGGDGVAFTLGLFLLYFGLGD